MDILSKLSENLKYLMSEKEIRVCELASATGIDQSEIARFLRAERLPNLNTLVILADYFNCTANYLLGLEEIPGTQTFRKRPPFSEQLKIILDKSGKTKYRLQKDVHISELTVTAWQRGKYEPSIESIIKLANYFDCSVDIIIGRI